MKRIIIHSLGALCVSLFAIPAGADVNLDDPAIDRVESLGDGARRVVVKSGRTWTIRIGSSETVEKLLIDIDRPGANARIIASGAGWTVRNVGVKGKLKNGGHVLTLSGRDGTVDTVYLGDGATQSRAIGVFVVHQSSSGPIDFRRVHIAGFPNNGIYGSPTVETLRGALVNIYDSYFDTNNITNFKLGSPLGPCRVVNTVVRTDGDATPYVNGAVNARAFWALDNPGGDHPDKHVVIVENSDIQGRIAAEPGAIIELQDTRWSGTFLGGGDPNESGDPAAVILGQSAGQPDLTPPAGVPMTALEAATATPAPEPEPPGDLVATRAADAPAIDGLLEEAMWQAAALSFGDTRGASENRVEVRALWDESALYLGWTVEDSILQGDPQAPPYRVDSVELFLDPRRDGGPELRPDDLHVVVTQDGGLLAKRGDRDLSEAEGFEYAVSSGAGFRVELRLPWSELVEPQEGLEMGALLANNDLDDGAIEQFSASGLTPFAQPDAWRALRLAAEPDKDGEEDGEDGGSSAEPEEDPSAGCAAMDGGGSMLGVLVALALVLAARRAAQSRVGPTSGRRRRGRRGRLPSRRDRRKACGSWAAR